jgi:hypothetical protein
MMIFPKNAPNNRVCADRPSCVDYARLGADWVTLTAAHTTRALGGPGFGPSQGDG